MEEIKKEGSRIGIITSLIINVFVILISFLLIASILFSFIGLILIIISFILLVINLFIAVRHKNKIIATIIVIFMIIVIIVSLYVLYGVYYKKINTGEYHSCTQLYSSGNQCDDIPCPNKPYWQRSCENPSSCQEKMREMIKEEDLWLEKNGLSRGQSRALDNSPYKNWSTMCEDKKVCKCYYSRPLM